MTETPWPVTGLPVRADVPSVHDGLPILGGQEPPHLAIDVQGGGGVTPDAPVDPCLVRADVGDPVSRLLHTGVQHLPSRLGIWRRVVGVLETMLMMSHEKERRIRHAEQHHQSLVDRVIDGDAPLRKL